MKLLANNFGSTTLAGPISNTATSLSVQSGAGALFPNPGAGQYFVVVLNDAATGLVYEVLWCTARSGDTLTVIRAQENTSAQSWLAGDKVLGLMTAGQLETMAQVSDLQTQAGNYAVDAGTANAGVITLNPAPVSLASLTGVPIRVLKINAANTAAYSLSVNGFAATAVVLPTLGSLLGGELPASAIFEVISDGTNFELKSVTGLTPRRFFYAGNPNGNLAGALGDECQDTADNIKFFCSVAGNSATAQWVQPITAAHLLVPLSIVNITASGAYSQAVPTGATVCVATANASGGGGGGVTTSGAASGGSAGQWIQKTFSVTVGNSITGTVGAGGSAGTTGANGGTGHNTTIVYGASTWTANGGAGGLTATTAAAMNSVAGGSGATGGADSQHPGQDSYGGVVGYGGGTSSLYYGGNGGASPNGGFGGSAGTGAPNNGGAPGGGGGGGAASAGGGSSGGAGAAGQVTLTFY